MKRSLVTAKQWLVRWPCVERIRSITRVEGPQCKIRHRPDLPCKLLLRAWRIAVTTDEHRLKRAAWSRNGGSWAPLHHLMDLPSWRIYEGCQSLHRRGVALTATCSDQLWYHATGISRHAHLCRDQKVYTLSGPCECTIWPSGSHLWH